MTYVTGPADPLEKINNTKCREVECAFNAFGLCFKFILEPYCPSENPKYKQLLSSVHQEYSMTEVLVGFLTLKTNGQIPYLILNKNKGKICKANGKEINHPVDIVLN